MIFDTPISAFRNAKSTEPVTVRLAAFLKDQKHSGAILALRAEADPDRRSDLKKKLPAATISGTFTKRAAGNIVTYNGLVCLDFDAKENPGIPAAEMKNRLAGFDEVAYAAISAGGAGVFAIIPTNNTDPTTHATVVDLLGAVIHSTVGLTYDRACKDVSRLRFLSYDPDAWWNPQPATFDARHIIALQQEQENIRPPRPLILRQSPRHTTLQKSREGGAGGGVDNTPARVDALISAVEQGRTDLTDNYDDWIRLGLAIAAYFGPAGEDYYQRLSQFHPKYDHAETAKKYEDFCRNGRRIKIGTFFKILESRGYSL